MRHLHWPSRLALARFWLAGTIAFAMVCPAFAQLITKEPPSNAAVPGAPLWVDGQSHVIVMQYEAWFGPDAVTFQNAEAMPLLQSADPASGHRCGEGT